MNEDDMERITRESARHLQRAAELAVDLGTQLRAFAEEHERLALKMEALESALVDTLEASEAELPPSSSTGGLAGELRQQGAVWLEEAERAERYASMARMLLDSYRRAGVSW